MVLNHAEVDGLTKIESPAHLDKYNRTVCICNSFCFLGGERESIRQQTFIFPHICVYFHHLVLEHIIFPIMKLCWSYDDCTLIMFILLV